jgi:acyl carrier protein
MTMVSSEQIIEMIKESMLIELKDKNKVANSTLQELGLDSLDCLEFLYLVQDKYDLNIKSDQYNSFMNYSPENIAEIINSKFQPS